MPPEARSSREQRRTCSRDVKSRCEFTLSSCFSTVSDTELSESGRIGRKKPFRRRVEVGSSASQHIVWLCTHIADPISKINDSHMQQGRILCQVSSHISFLAEQGIVSVVTCIIYTLATRHPRYVITYI